MNTTYLNDLKLGYQDANGVTKLDFILKHPQQLAKDFGAASPKLSTKQARSFFNACNKIYLDFISKKTTLAEAKLELAMLSTKVADKFNKGAVPQDFKDFFDANVAAIKTDKDMKSFIMHFEAVCNYLKDAKTQPNNGGAMGNKPSNNNFGNKSGQTRNYNNNNKYYGGTKR